MFRQEKDIACLLLLRWSTAQRNHSATVQQSGKAMAVGSLLCLTLAPVTLLGILFPSFCLPLIPPVLFYFACSCIFLLLCGLRMFSTPSITSVCTTGWAARLFTFAVILRWTDCQICLVLAEACGTKMISRLLMLAQTGVREILKKLPEFVFCFTLFALFVLPSPSCLALPDRVG